VKKLLGSLLHLIFSENRLALALVRGESLQLYLVSHPGNALRQLRPDQARECVQHTIAVRSLTTKRGCVIVGQRRVSVRDELRSEGFDRSGSANLAWTVTTISLSDRAPTSSGRLLRR
jgi:hypothetical protein